MSYLHKREPERVRIFHTKEGPHTKEATHTKESLSDPETPKKRSVEPKTSRIRMTKYALFALAMGSSIDGAAQTWTLVDFQSTQETSITPYGDWQTVLFHPQYMTFVAPTDDPMSHGIAETNQVPEHSYTSTFAGISGVTPIAFEKGDKIIATFFNQSESRLRLQARISFSDANEPGEDFTTYTDWNNPWYTMYAENASHNDFVAAGGYGRLVFNITNENSVSAPNALPTEGQHSLINISMDPRYNAWHGAFVLTRIEYSKQADVTPPSTPGDLQVNMVAKTESDLAASAVELSWLPSADSANVGQNSGVNRYAIYRNEQFYAVVEGDWIDHHLATTGRVVYHDLAIKSGSTYHYQVTAIDGAVTGHYRVPGSDIQFGNESDGASVTITVPHLQSNQLILAESDIRFIGAFRLPVDYDGQNSAWSYASSGLAWRPQEDDENGPGEIKPGHLPGSLYGVGHPLAPQIAEFTIPKPIVSQNPLDFRRAELVQPFSTDIWPAVYDSGWQPAGGGDAVVGITWHDEGTPETRGLYYAIHNAYAMGETRAHGFIAPDLSGATGAWHLGGLLGQDGYLEPSLTDRYLFSAPASWVQKHAQSRQLLVGQGYQSGEGIPSYGPTVFAISPTEKNGRLPVDKAVVKATTLLRYGTDGSTPEQWLSNWSLTMGYSGAAWLESNQKSAVAFAVSRPLGDTWYGGEDGTVTFTSDLDLPMTRTSSGQIRGPMATQRQVSLYLYNPDDLAKVASGELQPWQPQPYQIVDLKADLMGGLSERETNAGAIAFDSENGFLYMIQSNADTSWGTQGYNRRSLIYVWKIGDVDHYDIEYGPGDGQHNDGPAPPVEASAAGFVLTGSTCHLDVDGNGLIDSETDGYLLYRLIDNWSDDSLVAGRVGENAIRTTASALRQWYQHTFSGVSCHLDIDGDGIAWPQTDGFIAYRYMQGLTGWQLVNGITAAAATRAEPETVKHWLDRMFGQPQRTCHLDVDGDGLMLAETDGYLLYRYLDDYAPEDIVKDRIAKNAIRSNANEIVTWLDSQFDNTTGCHLDVDGDGIVYAGTDGNLLFRFLQGLQGSSLTNGATAAGASRSEPEDVMAWMMLTYVGEH